MGRGQIIIDFLRNKKIFFYEINMLSQMANGLDEHKDDIRILCIGDSHCQYSINPRYSKEFCYNVSSPSQDLYLDYHVLKNNIQKLKNLKKVVLVVSFYNKHFDIYRTSASHMGLMFEHFFLTPARKRIINLKLMQELLTFRKEHIKPTLYNGYRHPKSYNNVIETKSIVEKHYRIYKKYENDELIYLDKIISLCKQNGVDLTLLISPFSLEYTSCLKEISGVNNLNELYSEIIQQAQKNDVTVLDSAEIYNFSEGDFGDCHHMTSECADKFSEKLFDIIYK